MKLCKNLRYNGYHPAMDDQQRLEVVFLNQVQYSCLHTCQPWGIDDGPVLPETCNAGRPCFRGADDEPEPSE